MLREFNLSNVEHMADGTIAAVFDVHMARAIADAEDHPGNKKGRKVILELEVTPVVLQDGAVTEVEIEAKVKSSVPAHVSRPIECEIKIVERASVFIK